jgi:hypothetical protein
MRKLALVVCFASTIAFAQGKSTPPKAADKPMGMMGNWAPRKVTKEDRQGIEAAMDAFQKAWTTGDASTAMAMVDYPIFVATDDKDGNVVVNMQDQMVETSMKSMMSDKDVMATASKTPKPKMDIFFITDDMAVVTARSQVAMGKDKVETRAMTFLVNKGGKWMIKGQVQGGWGEAAKAQMAGGEMRPGTATPGAPPRPTK